jgi:putative flippase GtrA
MHRGDRQETVVGLDTSVISSQVAAAEESAARLALRELLRMARFGIVGTAAALCYASTSFLIVWSGLGSSISATIIGHVAAALISYYGHLHFSFQVEPNHRRFVWRFLVVALTTFALNLILTWSLTSILHAPYQVPIAVVTVVLPVASYLVNRLWVFDPGIDDRSAS